MAEHRFSLALEKTETTILIKARVLSKLAVEYLGIMIHNDELLRADWSIADKAAARIFTICWLLFNVGVVVC